jgi:hypothetical protein
VAKYLIANPDQVFKLDQIKGFTDLNDFDISFIKALLQKKNIPSKHIDLCESILQKVNSNSFTITDPEMKPIGIGFYIEASVINHSCDPNCYQTFVNDRLSIKTVRSVFMNEEITLSYIDIGKPTFRRQKELYDSYHFRCDCSRCTIKGFDTLNGWKCNDKRCNGLLFPVDDATVFKNWLKGTTFRASVESLDSNYLQRSALNTLPLPCEELFFLPESKLINTSFTCTECFSEFPISLIIDRVLKISIAYRRVKSMSFLAKESMSKPPYTIVLKEFQVLIKYCEDWLPRAHYALLDVLSIYSMLLISLSRYKEAYFTIQKNLLAYYYNYPPNHPLISLQELQLAKLAAYLFEDPNYSIRHANRALTSLKLSHDPPHHLFETLTNIFSSLNT